VTATSTITNVRFVPVTVHATTPADLDVFVTTLDAAFARFPGQPEEDGSGVFWSALEMDRNLLAVTDDGQTVGTAAGYSFELTLPGGVRIPTTGVTNVGVLPSHRRRGIAAALMRRQLADYDAVASSGDEAWLWLRILDVAGALQARAWAGSGDLVLQVEDAFLEESSRYLLSVVRGQAECTVTTGEPDLVLDTSDLASLYLGGVPPRDLLRAGRVWARDAATVERAQALFATERAPWSHHIF